MKTFHNLEAAFAYYTECALATSERFEMISKPPKGQAARAKSIAAGMVAECKAFYDKMDSVERRRVFDRVPRLTRILSE